MRFVRCQAWGWAGGRNRRRDLRNPRCGPRITGASPAASQASRLPAWPALAIPGPVTALSTGGDLQPPPAPARRGRGLEPVRGPRLPARLHRARVLPRRRPGPAMRGARPMAAGTGHSVPDRVGYRMGRRRQPAPRPPAPAPRPPGDPLPPGPVTPPRQAAPSHQVRRAPPADLDRRHAHTRSTRMGRQTPDTNPAHRHRPSRRTHPPRHRPIPAVGR